LQVLREELGFAGAVFSDDLLMEGASSQGSILERANGALAAGCDFALVCSDSVAIDSVLDGLRWHTSDLFAQRSARLVPRGPAPTIAELRASELYRVARADCEPLFVEA
jgi:beta-N-acetylhexosaminidase